MNILKIMLLRLLLVVGSLVLLLIITSIVIVLLEIRVNLNTLRRPVEAALEKGIGRKVHFLGDLSLVPTLWPTLEIQEVRIGNPPDWGHGIFAKADLMRIQLGIMPLLKKKIHLGEITGKGVNFNLVNNQAGASNWTFQLPEKEPRLSQESTTDKGFVITVEAINSLDLKDVSLNYQDQKINHRFRFHLKEMEGNILPGKPFELYAQGTFEKKTYQLKLTGGSFRDLQNRAKNWPVQIKANISGTPVNIKGTLVRKGEPELHAELSTGRVDIGAVLDSMKIASNITASTDALAIQTQLRGKSLSELLANARFNLTISRAAWILKDANTQAQLPIMINKGQFIIKPEKPVLLTLDSKIDQDPVLIEIKASKLADFGLATKTHPLEIKVRGTATELIFNSDYTLPITMQNLDFKIQVQGDRLNRLNRLLKADLPPVGPYTLTGGFKVSPKGYEINHLLLQVGSSRLRGDLSLATIVTPPVLAVRLQSQMLQIDDFNLQDWTARRKMTATDGKPLSQSDFPDQSDKKIKKLLTPEVFQSLEAKVDIQVRQVFSGSDMLGRGSLWMTLDRGRLKVNPLKVEVPGGNAELQLELYPAADHVEVVLQAKLDKFDYGILARRIDKNSPADGKLSLDVNLSANVNDQRNLLAKGNGYFNFAVWPANRNADVFELWAVNLLNAIVSETDKKKQSKINCAVAGFHLKDGLMQQKVLFLDTTRMQIQGIAVADFKKEEIELYVEPKAKKPEFFSFATPIKITGHFEAFGVGINPLRLAGSIIKFVISPVVVPFHRLFIERTPPDGEKACEEAWQMGKTVISQ